MAASFIEVVAQDGGRFNAYVARPAQGSGPGLVLLQVGLLNPEGLPVAGIESARKLLDETLPSNQLMGSKSRV